MVELLGIMNVLGKGVGCHIPKNALSSARYKIKRSVAIDNRNGWKEWERRRTLSMDPQERTLCIPFLESVGLDEPFCGSTLMRPAGNVVISGWIWWGKPASNFLL
jgi:hypothetical protein